MRFSIDKKFAFTAMGVILILGVIIGSYLNRHMTEYLVSELDERAALLIKNVASGIEYPLLINDRESVGNIVNRFLNQKDLIYCKIEGSKGETIYQAGEVNFHPSKEYRHSIKIKREKGEPEEDLLFESEELNEEEVIGNIFILLSLSDLNSELRSVRKNITLITVVAILIVALINSLLFRLIAGGPLSLLVNATKRISEGDLNVRIPVKSHDEFALLADSFNRMTQELTKHRNNLEEIVEERTDELIKANEELKLSQEHLVQSEKMASLGQLVAGVAHEINTPIGIGVTAASHLSKITLEIKASYEEESITRSSLEGYFADAVEGSEMILKHLSRTSELIKSFKMVSADQTSRDRRVFEVKSYMEDILLSLKPKLRRTAHKIELNCPDNVKILSYPGALAQVMTNLIMNSLMHAYEDNESGTIQIEVVSNGKDILVKHIDDGKGIPSENMKKIFDPFFTTGRVKGGTGLGLHIVYNIVNKTLNGRISCESSEGKGTTFTINLPITE